MRHAPSSAAWSVTAVGTRAPPYDSAGVSVHVVETRGIRRCKSTSVRTSTCSSSFAPPLRSASPSGGPLSFSSLFWVGEGRR